MIKPICIHFQFLKLTAHPPLDPPPPPVFPPHTVRLTTQSLVA